MPPILPADSSDFFAHHSPFGAFASFTVGRYGKRGGFGLELGGPAEQDVYVALVRPGQSVRALPFYAGSDARGAEAYTGEAAAAQAATSASAATPLAWQPFAPGEIQRTMGWASDTWTAGDLTFRLLTPFAPIPEIETLGDGELRRHLCPAVIAEITVDNTQGTDEAFAFFGIGDKDPLRPLSDATNNKMRGVAGETRWGFAVALPPASDRRRERDVREVLSWGVLEAVARASSQTVPPRHRLANRGGVLLRARAGQKRTYTLALGFYRGGVVTSGIAASYLYARLFADLESVLAYALEHAAEIKKTTEARDAELDRAPLSPERRFLLAHATHSYHGATQLLHDERGVLPRVPFQSYGPAAQDAQAAHRPLWVVNEGEYRMINTFDLTADHAFWEVRHHPWSLRNTLDLFVARYSYQDETQDATDAKRPHFPGGISFTHDMGVANQFSPPGYSSYELGDLTGCFSYMTQEQLCNWCVCAALYGLPTRLASPQGNRLSGGDRLWLAARRQTLRACLESLVHRDGPGELRNGVMSLDSLRCGKTGQEITTYDSLDASLGQARANGYLAVKTWAAYLALGRCFDALGLEDEATLAEEQAALAAANIAGHFDHARGCFPAVFEDENAGGEAQIIPAIEGLVFPWCLGDDDAVSEHGPFGELASLLKRHLETVLTPGVCVDEQSGGWKLSSSSTNTWMSKIFLCQFVAERILGLPPLADSFDAAHAKWQQGGACRDFAFTDQVRSTDGLDLGSRYYPRGVTALLWLLR